MHRDMVSADGQRFDLLIEVYWQPPTQQSHQHHELATVNDST